MASRSPAQSTLFILDFGTAHDPNDPLHRGRLIRAASDGTSFEPIVDNLYLPDAIDILQDEGRLYWTCMGIPGVQDGSVHSCLLDGTDLKQVVPTGLLNTPKQLVLDPAHRKIYTCDREGLKILRCDLDGKHLEVLVQTGDPNVGDHKADQMRWCVGLAIHWDERKMYWTQKGALSEVAVESPVALRDKRESAMILGPLGANSSQDPIEVTEAASFEQTSTSRTVTALALGGTSSV